MKNVPNDAVTVIADALWPWPSPTPPWCRTQAYALLAHPEAIATIMDLNRPVKEQMKPGFEGAVLAGAVNTPEEYEAWKERPDVAGD